MHIKINNESIILPNDKMNISEILEWRGFSKEGTALARNGKLILRDKWEITYPEDNDDIVIITAAFGG